MLITLNEAIKLINSGKTLHIAGDDSLLKQLPKGNWIGGTTPYFITKDGGVHTKEKLFVYEIDYAEETKIAVYGRYNVFQMAEEWYDNGLSIVILPFAADVTAKYAKDAPEVEELLMHPTVGWVSGYDLETGGEARVYNGVTGESFSDRSVVMHIKLPEGKNAVINIINIFEDNKNDPSIRFPNNTLDIGKCKVNGQEVVLADYIRKMGLNTKLPLVADYNGIFINASLKEVGETKVSLYAPVFRGIDYRFAAQDIDYGIRFDEMVKSTDAVSPIFSCNCILNFLYGELEGKKTPPFEGPITFGEIAYQLLNQTLVYCEIK